MFDLLKPVCLRAEYHLIPLGVDARPPRFSWNIEGNGRGRSQSAYCILAASSERLLRNKTPDLWNSGKIASSDHTFISYDGVELRSGQHIYWQVYMWDEAGQKTKSEIAWFETGLLHTSDWEGVFLSAPFCGVGGRGYHSAVIPSGKQADFWVQVDLKSVQVFERIVLYPCNYVEQGEFGKGFGFPVRFRIEGSNASDFKDVNLLFETQADLPNPGLKSYEVCLSTGTAARFIRLTVTKPFDAGLSLFALDEIQIFSGETNLALGKPVMCANSLESSVRAAQYDWHVECLTDGFIQLDEPQHDEGKGKGNLLRRVVHLSKSAVKARAYIAARGYYEMRINGKKVGDAVLDSPYTAWQKRLLYSTWDVTELLQAGDNVVTVLLGNGWPLEPAFMLQLNIEQADGSCVKVSSDAGWKIMRSPLLSNNIYHGEFYDATLENNIIFEPNFDDSSCDSATVISYRPELSSQMNPPIRIVESIRPVSISEPEPGVWVFDLAQNIAGWAQIRVKGESGQRITLRFAEMIFDDGSVWTDEEQTKMRREGYLKVSDGMINNANYRSARAKDIYICRGMRKEEIWEPRFTYHGFRFVELTGYPGTPTKETILGRVVHTDVKSTGHFECSDPVMNWTQNALRWGILDNLHSIPSDCPQRDERQGWMADAHLVAEAALFNFDIASTYIKWLCDMRDSQRADGAIGDTTPYTLGHVGGDVSWGSAIALIAWYTYLYTGDQKILEEHFDAMKRFVEYFANKWPNRIVDDTLCFGDWLCLDPTPQQLINTGYFYWCSRIVANSANILGRKEDSYQFHKLADEIANAFHSHFFNPEAVQYGNGSQFSNGWPLYLGVVPEEFRQLVFEKITIDIEKRGGHLSSGLLGTKYLMELLCDMGRDDLAFTAAQSHEYPGWGYMQAHGATTLWEHWSLKTGSDMNSHNHPAFGAIGAWFMKYVAGIRPDSVEPGFQHIIFAPTFTKKLDYVTASVETIRGKVCSAWRRDKSLINLTIFLPASSRGSLLLQNVSEISDGSRMLWKNGRIVAVTPGVVAIEDKGEKTILQLESGEYNFLVKLRDGGHNSGKV